MVVVVTGVALVFVAFGSEFLIWLLGSNHLQNLFSRKKILGVRCTLNLLFRVYPHIHDSHDNHELQDFFFLLPWRLTLALPPILQCSLPNVLPSPMLWPLWQRPEVQSLAPQTVLSATLAKKCSRAIDPLPSSSSGSYQRCLPCFFKRRTNESTSSPGRSTCLSSNRSYKTGWKTLQYGKCCFWMLVCFFKIV